MQSPTSPNDTKRAATYWLLPNYQEGHTSPSATAGRSSLWAFVFFFLALTAAAQEVGPQKPRPGSIATLSGHNAVILSLAMAPDGLTAATGSSDRTVVLWDTQTGGEKLKIRAAGSGVTAVAFNTEGTILATGSRDKDVIFWDTKAGRQLKRFPNHTATVTSLAIHGKYLVFGLDSGQAGVWDIETEKPLHPLNEHSRSINAVALPENRAMAVFASADRTASVWDLASGKLRTVFKEHQGPVESVACDLWGNRVITGSADRTALIWNSATGKVLQRLEGHAAPVTFVAFAPDGATVYTASSDGVFIQWNTATGKEVVRCTAEIPVARAAMSTDAFYMIASKIDQTASVFRTDSLRFNPPRQPPPTGKGPFAHLLTPDKPVLRLNPLQKPSLTRITISQTAPLDPLSPKPVDNIVAFHPVKPWCVTVGGDKNGALWNLENGETLCQFACSSAFTSVAVRPQGNLLAAGAQDGSLFFFDAATGENLHFVRGHTRTVNDIAFSADGTRILTAGEDRNLVFWNVESGKSLGVFQGHTGPVHAVTFTSDDQAISVSADRTVRLWKTGDKSSVASEEQASPLISLALSSDGTWFAVGESGAAAVADGKPVLPGISLWDFETLKPIDRIETPESQPRTLAISPDGQILASGGVDGTVVFWDVKTRKAFRAFPQIPRDAAEKMEAEALRCAEQNQWYRFRLDNVDFEPIRTIAFSNDGSRLVSSGGRDTLLWDISKQKPPSILIEQAEQRRAAAGPESDRTGIASAPLGRLIHEISGFTSPILDIAPTRDGARLAVCLSSKAVLLLSADSGEEISRFTAAAAFQACSFLPDGRTILAGGEDGRFYSRNTILKKSNFMSKVHTDRITCLAVTPSGAKAVTGDNAGMVVVWDTKKGDHLGRLIGEHRKAINDVAINRDGSRILVASEDRKTILWDGKTHKPLLKLNDHRKPVRAVAFSPDGNSFVTVSTDQTGIVYQTATGKELYRLESTAPFVSAEFGSSGNVLLTGDESGSAVLWNADDGKPIRRFPAKFKTSVNARFFNSEKRLLVTDPQTIRIFETEGE